MNTLWTEYFRPNKIDDYIGNKENIDLIKEWILNHKNKVENTKKILLLHGTPGVGKTTIAHIIFNEYNYDVLEFNASDQRTKKMIKNRLGCIGKYSVVNYKEVGLIMDEIDGITGGDKNSINEFINIIIGKNNKFKFPVICTCNSIKDKKLNTLLRKSLVILIKKPTKPDLTLLLDKIIIEKNISITNKDKKIIIQNSNNDYRSLITNIYQYSLKSGTIYLNKEQYKLDLQNIEILDNLSKLEYLLKNKINTIALYNECHLNDVFYYFNIYDNYINILKTNKSLNLNNILYILNNYKYTNKLKNFIYTYQYWDLNNYITFIGILSNINKLISKSKKYLQHHTKYNLFLLEKSNINKKISLINNHCNLNNIENMFLYNKINPNNKFKNEFTKINTIINKLNL